MILKRFLKVSDLSFEYQILLLCVDDLPGRLLLQLFILFAKLFVLFTMLRDWHMECRGRLLPRLVLVARCSLRVIVWSVLRVLVDERCAVVIYFSTLVCCTWVKTLMHSDGMALRLVLRELFRALVKSIVFRDGRGIVWLLRVFSGLWLASSVLNWDLVIVQRLVSLMLNWLLQRIRHGLMHKALSHPSLISLPETKVTLGLQHWQVLRWFRGWVISTCLMQASLHNFCRSVGKARGLWMHRWRLRACLVRVGV